MILHEVLIHSPDSRNMETQTITETELLAYFETEQGGDQALEKFFDLHQTGAMAFEYRLKRGIELIDDRDDEKFEGLFRRSGIAVANKWCRHKRKLKYKKLLKSRPHAPRLVSEGDSWFQHPLIEETIDHLYDHYNIRSLGAAADTLTNIHRKREFLRHIRNERPQAFLLSGLGNDVLFDMKARLLDYTPDNGTGARRHLNTDTSDPASYESQMRQGIYFYREIIQMIHAQNPGLPIVTHGYDYIIPGDNGGKGRFITALKERGIPIAEGTEVARIIVDDFNQRLQSLAGKFENVYHVDCRNAAPHPWNDEIHPDGPGFDQVAARIHGALQDILS